MNNNVKNRYARRLSETKSFEFNGNSDKENKQVIIELDELEAIRLCDFEMLSQIEASKEMQISRATIQRLLLSARKKNVDAFVNNKTIIINNNIKNIKLKGENNMDKHLKEVIKVAVPTINKEFVGNNFGGARYFAIYMIKEAQSKFVEFIDLPQHKAGEYPNLLKENNIDVVIVRAMGINAINLLKDNSIDVILGTTGQIEAAVEEYIAGTLNSNNQTANYARNRQGEQGCGRGKGHGRGKDKGCNQGLGLGRNKNG
jgi:predicted DNA-binding protein (UPF0251 family)/predicted Fe-Mo cluster-binding NifX family protein